MKTSYAKYTSQSRLLVIFYFFCYHSSVGKKTSQLTLITYSRGAAALSVVLFHIAQELASRFNYQPFFKVLSPLSFGVDFFFVLSGFILFYSHKKDFGHADQFVPFLKKRFIRIFPTYWILLTVSILVFWLTQTHIAQTPLLSPLFITQSYLLFPFRTPIIAPSWTLSYEIFFYALFAFSILVKKRTLLLTLLVCYIGLLLPLNILLPEHFFLAIGGWLEIALRYYVVEFFLGVAAGYLLSSLPKFSFSSNIKLLATTGGILFLEWLSELFFPSFTMLLRLFLFSPAIALLLFSLARIDEQKHITPHVFFKLLGEASYPLYLMQAFLILVFFKLVTFVAVPTTTFFMSLLGVLALLWTLFPAFLFHLYVERPILRRLKR